MFSCFKGSSDSDSDADQNEDTAPRFVKKSRYTGSKSGAVAADSSPAGTSPSKNAAGPSLAQRSKSPRKWDDASLDLSVRVAMAVEGGDVDLLRQAMERRDNIAPADFNVFAYRSREGDSLLHVACRHGNIEAGQQLLAGPAPPQGKLEYLDLRNDSQETALLLAVSGNYPELSRFLIASGADLRAKNCHNENVLYLACYVGASELVDEILATDIAEQLVLETNSDGYNAQMISGVMGYLDIAQRLHKFTTERVAHPADLPQ